jgi:hypothetical protein
VEVTAPRVNDRRTDPATSERQRFTSAILPPWCRAAMAAPGRGCRAAWTAVRRVEAPARGSASGGNWRWLLCPEDPVPSGNGNTSTSRPARSSAAGAPAGRRRSRRGR